MYNHEWFFTANPRVGAIKTFVANQTRQFEPNGRKCSVDINTLETRME